MQRSPGSYFKNQILAFLVITETVSETQHVFVSGTESNSFFPPPHRMDVVREFELKVLVIPCLAYDPEHLLQYLRVEMSICVSFSFCFPILIMKCSVKTLIGVLVQELLFLNPGYGKNKNPTT